MAYALRCADSGTDCLGQFQARTEDELMQHVELHLKEAHPDMELTAEAVEMVKGWSARLGPAATTGTSRASHGSTAFCGRPRFAFGRALRDIDGSWRSPRGRLGARCDHAEAIGYAERRCGRTRCRSGPGGP